jgi:HlyD family secretion protein
MIWKTPGANREIDLRQTLFVSILFGLLSVLAVGCDSVGPSRAAPTFIPPTVANPTGEPGALTTGQTPGVGKSPGVVLVTRGALAQTILARGQIGSVHEAVLYFPLAGVVNQILVASGDQVAQGAPIAQLDTFQLEQDVTTAQFALDKANLQLKQAQAQASMSDFKIEIAATVYTRTLQARTLADTDYQAAPTDKGRSDRFQQADKDFLQASVDLNNARMDKQLQALNVDSLNLAIRQTQKSLEQSQARLAGAKITAPFAGLVLSIDKNVGEQVQAFDPIGAIADPTQLLVETSIAESDALSVGLGQAATIVLDGFPDQKFTGKVKEISAKPSIFQGKSVYRVVIAFDQQAQVPATLRLGADIYLVTQVKNNVLSVPTSAISVEGSKRYVTAVRSGKPQRVEVQIGVASDTQTEILSGLSENEPVQVP